MMLSELIEELKEALAVCGDFVLIQEHGDIYVSIKSVAVVKVRSESERDQAARIVFETNEP